MTEQTIDDVRFRGVLWGLVAVLLGSLIYGLVTSPLIIWEISQTPLPYTKPRPDSPADLIDGYLQEGIVGILDAIFDLLGISMLVGLIGFVLWAIPGVLGGAVLSILIHFVTATLPSPIRVMVSLLIGSLIGALIGGASGFVFTPLFLLVPDPDITLVLRFFLPPALVGALCGAWAGWRLASGYRRVKPLAEELPCFRALFRGVGWGFAASVLSSLIYGLISDLFFRQYLSLGMVLFAFSVIPGSVFGGAILSMLLHILAIKTSLLSRNRALAGVFAGGVLWFLVTTFAFPFVFDMTKSIITLWLVAIATGAFIGWRLALAYGR